MFENTGDGSLCHNNSIGHYVMDVKPWIRWGNSPDDTTTSWDRMWGLLGVYG